MRRPLFAALAGTAAAVWITLLLFPWEPPDYEPYRNAHLCLTGTVCGLEPKLEGDTVVWRMMLSGVVIEASEGESASSDPPDPGEAAASASSKGPVPGKRMRVLCVLENEPAAEMSARVRVSGKLIPFRRAYNEGEFDLRLYYHILRTAYSLRDAEILAASTPSDPVAASLFHLKKFISMVIDRNFSSQNSPVLQAMLLGEKGLLEEETKELYQGAGIIHILSISGMHLSLLGMGLFSLLGRLRAGKLRLPLAARAALSILAILLYGKMIGMNTSAFRALVMMVLFIGSKVIGRSYDLLTASGIACILLLFDQPLYLLHTGFQFSFAAVLSMGILMPSLPGRSGAERQWKRMRAGNDRIPIWRAGVFGSGRLFWKNLLRETEMRLMPDGILKVLAIPVGTLPVYLWTYGTFPLWSLLLNLIVIPLMTVVMASAGCAVLLGALPALAGAETLTAAAGTLSAVTLSEGMGTFFTAAESSSAAGFINGVVHVAAFPAERILDLYRFFAEKSQSLPGHAVILGRPSPLQIILFYSMLLLLTAISTCLQMPSVRRQVEYAGAGAKRVGIKPSVRRQVEYASAGAKRVESTTSVRRRLEYAAAGGSPEEGGLKIMLADTAIRICRFFRLRDNRARRKFGGFCAAVWIAAAVLVLTVRVRPTFEMDVLYVGQGDGICIQCENRVYLIDGGSTTKEELAKYTLLPYLYCKGIRRLDAVILTHEDRDHCSALLEILEEAAGTEDSALLETLEEAAGTEDSALPVSIGRIILPAIAEEAKGENFRRIESLARACRIPVEYISRGQRIRSGNLTMDCLHPAREAAYPDENVSSTTLLLRYGNISALLTGDLEKEGEEDLLSYLTTKPELQEAVLHLSILKVAHHGSRGATSEDFLELVHPDTAVISAGLRNVYGHPHKDLLQRLTDHGIQVERTDISGTVMIRLRKEKYWISTYLRKTD